MLIPYIFLPWGNLIKLEKVIGLLEIFSRYTYHYTLNLVVCGEIVAHLKWWRNSFWLKSRCKPYLIRYTHIKYFYTMVDSGFSKNFLPEQSSFGFTIHPAASLRNNFNYISYISISTANNLVTCEFTNFMYVLIWPIAHFTYIKKIYRE